MPPRPEVVTCPGCLGPSLPMGPGGPPRPGELWLCPWCGEVSMFTEWLELRDLTGDETVRAMLSRHWPTIAAVRRIIRGRWRARGRTRKGGRRPS